MRCADFSNLHVILPVLKKYPLLSTYEIKQYAGLSGWKTRTLLETLRSFGYLQKAGLDPSNINRNRYQVKHIDVLESCAKEGRKPPFMGTSQKLGTPAFHTYVLPVMRAVRPGSEDAFKLPSRGIG